MGRSVGQPISWLGDLSGSSFGLEELCVAVCMIPPLLMVRAAVLIGGALCHDIQVGAQGIGSPQGAGIRWMECIQCSARPR